MKIELYGELAALLKPGTEPKNEHPQAESERVQITMVAGGRNRHYLSLNFAKIEGQFDRSNISQANI